MNNDLKTAFDLNIQSKFSYLPSHIVNMSVLTANDMLIIDSGLTSDMFNIICCQGTQDRISVITSIDHFKEKELPFAFWIGFEKEPVWLEDELKKMGLASNETEWAMACNLKNDILQAPQPNFKIKQISDEKAVRDLISVMNEILPKQEHQAIETLYTEGTNLLLDKHCPLKFFVDISMASQCRPSLSFTRQV